MATTWQAQAKRQRCEAFPTKTKTVLQQIKQELRLVQQITGCTTNTLNVVLRRLHPFLKGCEKIKADRLHLCRAWRASPVKVRLHGCVGVRCGKHVFGPSDIETECPQCGHPRFDEKGNPYEVFACLLICP